VCNFANWSFHENVIICQNKNRRKKVSFKSSLKFLFSHKSKFLLVTGGDVMITIFCEFGQFSAKKFAFFSKPMLWSNFFQNLALFWVKNANFFVKFFGENIQKIGPWGRCYDHNFLRIWTIFGEKLAFFSKTNVLINFFQKFSLVLSQKRQFFC
jgi:hypothetical protein